MRYDIAVIGNDEAAFEVLCVAGLAGQRTVGIIPEQGHSAWLVSQALRRLVGQLLADRNEMRQRLYHQFGSPSLLRRLLAKALTTEIEEHFRVLEGMGVDLLFGEGRIQNRNTVVVSSGMNCRRTVVEASNLVVGTGVRWTSVHRPLGFMTVTRPESLFAGPRLPQQLCLLGNDSFVAGLAALFSLFGVQTRLIATGERPCAMQEMAEASGVHVNGILDETANETRQRMETIDIVDCRRAVGLTEYLNLQRIGIEPDENGRLWCADNLETWCSGVFGVGDVVGFSAENTHHPTDQAQRVLNRVLHRVRKPHFLRIRHPSRPAVF